MASRVTALLGTDVTISNVSDIRFSRSRTEIGENTDIRVDMEEITLVGLILPTANADFDNLEPQVSEIQAGLVKASPLTIQFHIDDAKLSIDDASVVSFDVMENFHDYLKVSITLTSQKPLEADGVIDLKTSISYKFQGDGQGLVANFSCSAQGQAGSSAITYAKNRVGKELVISHRYISVYSQFGLSGPSYGLGGRSRKASYDKPLVTQRSEMVDLMSGTVTYSEEVHLMVNTGDTTM